jgi:hypothetical protein
LAVGAGVSKILPRVSSKFKTRKYIDAFGFKTAIPTDFLGQRLSRSTASPIQLQNNLAVGARVSDIYLGLAPELKLENILMLSLTGTRPEQMPCYLPEIYDFFGSQIRSGFMHWNKKLRAERVASHWHSASDSESPWALGAGGRVSKLRRVLTTEEYKS